MRKSLEGQSSGGGRAIPDAENGKAAWLSVANCDFLHRREPASVLFHDIIKVCSGLCPVHGRHGDVDLRQTVVE
jgi:hypothetical protein